MIDISTETLIPIGQVSAEIPSRTPGKSLHISTVWRWMLKGVKGVKLDSISIGGSRYTSREAVQRFVEQLSAEPSPQAKGDPLGSSPVRPQRSESRRLRDSEQAAQELERRGA